MIREHTVDSRRFPWERLTSRTGRRWLVCGLVVACAALVTMAAAGGKGPLAFVLIGAILAADVVLLWVTRRVAELPERAIDERQVAIRNRAHRLAYRIVNHAVLWPVALAVVLASFGDPNHWLAHLGGNTEMLTAAGTAICQLVCFLPTMILACTEPDSPAL